MGTIFPDIGMANGKSSQYLLSHCIRHWDDVFPVANSREIMGWVQSNSLVRNTVIAVAATHLRTKAPWGREHQVSENLQLSSAVEQYRMALGRFDGFGDLKHAQAILLCGTLLSLVAFALPSHELSEDGQYSIGDSWIFNHDTRRLGWMALQSGLRPVTLSLNVHREQSIADLGYIFVGNYDTQKFINQMSHPDLENIPEHWVEVFELVDEPLKSSCESPNPYRLPVIVLSNLRKLEFNEHSVYLYLMTLGKMGLEFRMLLAQGDTRAVWLIGYWLGLMCRFTGLWWCEQRARRDYQAICLWFSQIHILTKSNEERIAWEKLMKDLDSVAPSQ